MKRLETAVRAFAKRLPRVPYRYRRLVAAVCLALAAMLAVNAFLPDGRTTPVVVATADLAPGASLTSADVRVAQYPAGLVPNAAVADPAQILGRSVSAPIAEGTPVTTVGLLGSETLDAQPGQVLMPLRMADAEAASILKPGNTIAVFATPTDSIDGEPQRLLDSATVTQVGTPSDSPMDGSTGVLITVMVSNEEAGALASAGQSTVSFALLSGTEATP